MKDFHVFIRHDKVEAIAAVAKAMTENPIEGFALLVLAAKEHAAKYKQEGADWEDLPKIVNQILMADRITMPKEEGYA